MLQEKCIPSVLFIFLLYLCYPNEILKFIWYSTVFFKKLYYKDRTYAVKDEFFCCSWSYHGSLTWPHSWHSALAVSWIPLRNSSNSFRGRHNGQQRAHLILLIIGTWQSEEHGDRRGKDLRYQQVQPRFILQLRKLSPRGEKFFA